MTKTTPTIAKRAEIAQFELALIIKLREAYGRAAQIETLTREVIHSYVLQALSSKEVNLWTILAGFRLQTSFFRPGQEELASQFLNSIQSLEENFPEPPNESITYGSRETMYRQKLQHFFAKMDFVQLIYEEADTALGEYLFHFPDSEKWVSLRNYGKKIPDITSRITTLEAVIATLALISTPPEGTSILREIEFPPEYKDAGMAILSHFHDVLKTRKLHSGTKVRLEQEELIVRLVIEPPDGKTERIVEVLREYGEVMLGQKPIDKFAVDEKETLRLETALELARATINIHQNVILKHEKTIDGLQITVQNMTALIGNALTASQVQNSESAARLHEANIRALDIAEQTLTNADNQDARFHHEKMSLQYLAREMKDLAKDLDVNHVHQYEILVNALTSSPEKPLKNEQAIRNAAAELTSTSAGESLLRKAAIKASEWIIASGVPQGVNAAVAWELLKPYVMPG